MSDTLTLEDILEGLTKSAEESKEDSKEDSKEKKTEKEEVEDKKEVKEDESDAKKDLADAISKEEDVEKKAHLIGTAIAQDFLTKIASEVITSESNTVSKENEQMASTDHIEKAAAVNELVAAGHDFESAVALVKQAEAEILAESFEQEKQAALSELIAGGVDFNDAVELIKKAEAELTEQASQGAGGPGQNGIGVVAPSPNMVQQQIMQEEAEQAATVQPLPSQGTATDILNALVQKAQSQGQIGSYNAAETPFAEKTTNEVVKAAAVSGLVSQGYSVDQAVAMVKEAGLPLPTPTQVAAKAKSFGQKALDMAKSKNGKIGMGVAGAALAGVAARKMFAPSQEKQAAVSALMNEGCSFESAVDAVNSVTQ